MGLYASRQVDGEAGWKARPTVGLWLLLLLYGGVGFLFYYWGAALGEYWFGGG